MFRPFYAPLGRMWVLDELQLLFSMFGESFRQFSVL